MRNVVGIDIGGTNIDIGVVGKNYAVYEHIKLKTDPQKVDVFVDKICDAAASLADKYGCDAIGVGTPGRTYDNRVVISAGNIAYKNTPLAEIIEKRTGRDVYLDNDASCALYGEKFAGAGKNARHMVVLTIGTGIGGGIMIDRACYHGTDNRAGELGHFIMDINGEPCACGLRGCFEKHASVRAFVEQARKAAAENPSSLLYRLARGNTENIGGRLPFIALEQGCAVSKSVVDQYIYYLASGINSLAKIFRPELFVLTGGLINEGDIITRLLKPHLLEGVTAVLSPLKGKAGLIGAALIKTERESYAFPAVNV